MLIVRIEERGRLSWQPRLPLEPTCLNGLLGDLATALRAVVSQLRHYPPGSGQRVLAPFDPQSGDWSLFEIEGGPYHAGCCARDHGSGLDDWRLD
jgi:hypothetical protein